VAQKKIQTNEPVKTGQPVDRFQAVADQKLETFGRKLEGKGKPILYGLLALLVIGILGGVFYSYSRRQAAQAQTALGKAIDISEAQVSATPVPNSPEPSFPTEKERSEKAIAAFEEVAAKYGSPYKEKAQYFIAVNRLKLDRAAGAGELQNLTSSGNGEVAALSKFALAETRVAEGNYDQATALYNELLGQNNSIIPSDTINFALASVYEKQGKKADAANIYFNLAKTAREAKDAEGKPVNLSLTAREAARKLEKLDPARYGQLPPEPTDSSFGASPVGT
jgi:tetratricopeptide (TPR) repeat protein